MHGKRLADEKADRIPNSFNGAVHRSARKGGDGNSGGDGSSGFNGAVHRSARKGDFGAMGQAPRDASTEPCTGVHGKQLDPSILSGVSAAQLQRSRAPECTERSATTASLSRSRSSLQRSRAPECTESPSGRPGRRSRPRASTEPCTGVHGKYASKAELADLERRFNGAVHRSARKAAASPTPVT